MKIIKFRYTCQRANGHTFHHDFTIEMLVNGDAKLWNTINNIGGSDKTFWRQYTGAKDKNKREVYEGDIYKQTDNDGSIIIGEIIFYDDHSFRIRQGQYIYHFIKFTGEIIGNIYENPELLESK